MALDMLKACREHVVGPAVSGALPRQDIEFLCDEVETLRAQNKQLHEQVTRLQERSGEQLSERRGVRYQVHEFHHAMGVPVCSTPTTPDDDRVRLRLRLITEEFFELLDAALGACREEPWLASKGESMVLRRIEMSQVSVDVVELADAMADLDYVVEGTRLEFGINGWPIAQEVHRSNMAKVGAAVRDDGKILKPAGWTPPDIANELKQQGWKGPNNA